MEQAVGSGQQLLFNELSEQALRQGWESRHLYKKIMWCSIGGLLAAALELPMVQPALQAPDRCTS